MSKNKNSLYVQLGDIIQITSPADISIHNKIFLVTFISNTNIKLVSDSGNDEYIIRLNDDGTIGNESITSISILSRDENTGYARQNHLLPGTWIDVFFTGDLPVTITGLITNIEEDMIEIKTYPDNDIIYLDFAYKGLPEDIPIEKIIIRIPPSEFIEKEDETREKEIIEYKEIEEDENEFGIERSDETPSYEKVTRTTPIELKVQIKELLVDADKIFIGEQLEEIVQIVDVPEYEQRYNIDKQTSDLLDEMLSSIPNIQRNATVINNIHKLIERFKQLRSEYSLFDKYGNASMPELKGADYKPLVESLMNLNKKLYWLLPVSKMKKKVYDIDNIEDNIEDYKDVISLTLADERIKEEESITMYKNNSIPDGENKYSYLIKELNGFFTPYEDPSTEEYRITTKEVEDNITSIIDNLDDLKSSVVIKDGISRRKFIIQTYNLGLSKLETIETQRKKSYLKRVKLTSNDKMTIKSFISLPEPALKYSHINLPNTNILDKSSLNMNHLCYWKLLVQNSPINQFIVDDLNKELIFDEKTYLNDVKEYLLNETIDDPDKYNKFLKTIVPKTRILFNLIKKYINGNLSLYSIVKFLEPFLIYQKDLSFKQYETINEFIEEKIKSFKKKYIEKTKEFRLLYQQFKKNIDQRPLLLSNISYNIDKKVFAFYDITSFERNSIGSNEFLNKINEIDYGEYLQNILSDITQELYLPKHLKVFNNENKKLDDLYISENKNDICSQYSLAKTYDTLEHLENDNNVNIFFDNKYTHPIYITFINDYKKQKETMNNDDFKLFLINEIINKEDKTQEEAEEIAVSNILGKRLVKDGNYANVIIHDEQSDLSLLDKTYSTLYFKRVANKWETTDIIGPNTFINTNKDLCNIQNKCFYAGPVCKNYKQSEISLKTKTIDDIQQEYSTFPNFYYSNDRLDMIQHNLAYMRYVNPLLFNYKKHRMYKYNNQHVYIGETADEYDIVISPYSKIRNLILGQTDFVKKQDTIIRFANEFTREPMEEEDKYWFYCIKTNTKLLPIFFVRLAKAFITGEDYNSVYEKICTEQGTISDDGNAWVDKYSGYVIGRIDFDTEEGYDEQGFKINTRDLMQIDISDKITATIDETKQYENPIARQIANVLYAMTSFMGIELINQRDFIVKNTLVSLQNEDIVPSKTTYEKVLQSALSKGKKLPSYDTVYDSSLIYLTLSFMLIGILTSMPSIKSKKTFPNCIKSFSGYPLTGIEDKTAITYIACVAHKIKSSIKPWTSIQKASQQNIMTRLEAILDRYIIINKDVQIKLNEKREYLLQNEQDIIPIEHDIINWINFLPPLREIKLQTPINISSEFKTQLIDNLKKGKSTQYEQIEVIKSKIMHFSLSIQKLIQNVISKETPILKTASMEPYLENACCNGEGIDTHNYFVTREPDIITYNNAIIELKNIIDDIDKMTEASILYDAYDTKRSIDEVSSEFTEDTIFRTFVVYCRFNNILPIHENMRGICLEKPDNISIDDSISQIVVKLKKDGRNYNKDSLDMLMKIINTKNIIKLNIEHIEFSPIFYLRNITENKENQFQSLLYDVLDTYDVALLEDNKETRHFKNFLGRENDNMLERFKLFIRSHSKLTKNEYNDIIDTVTNLTKFNLIENDIFNNPENATTYVYTDFIKNTIRNLIYVYPNIILNKVDYDSIDIPRHWKISHRHSLDIQSFIKKYYSSLKSFYNNKHIIGILNAISNKTQKIYNLAEHTPFFSPITRDNKEIYSIFDKRIISLIFNYYLLKILNTYIDLMNDKELLITEPLKDIEIRETMTEVELQESITGDISEIEILRGEQKEIASNISDLLIAFVSIIKDEKKSINYNYEKIMEQVLRSKEKEKDDITNDLKRLTDDDREVENIFKNSKLEKWGVGLQKGFTKYAEGTYDKERENMEKRLLLDIQLGKNVQVHEMNAEIYENDLLENMNNEEMYDGEANDLSHLPEDDDYGDREDREDVDGYNYMLDDARYGYDD
jgi:hypothetical protein